MKNLALKGLKIKVNMKGFQERYSNYEIYITMAI